MTASRGRLAARIDALRHPGVLVATGLVVLVAVAYLWVDPGNPPGVFQDEAAIGLDAHAIATTGRDQHGALMPVFFRSLDDWKSPEYVYLLAGVYRLTGPSEQVARTLSASLLLAAVLAAALLARRRSGSGGVGLAVLLVGAATPWLYELGRLVFEVALVPLALLLVLLVVERSQREDDWRDRRALLLAGALSVLTYAYSGTRPYGPVLAVALPLACGLRRRFLGVVAAGYAALLLPLVLYALRHPGSLSSRLGETTFVSSGMGVPSIVRRFVENYAGYWDLRAWVTSGDPIPRHHVQGVGSLSLVVALLAGASVVLFLLRRAPFDPFWRYVAAATVFAPVGAALTDNSLHSLRAVPLVVCLLVLTIPALTFLRAQLARGSRPALVVAVVLGALWAFGTGDFARTFRDDGPARRVDYHADVPALLAQGLRARPRLLVEDADLVARDEALWYLLVHDLGSDRLVVMPASALVPGAGQLVFGSTDDCPFACERVAEADGFWLARRS